VSKGKSGKGGRQGHVNRTRGKEKKNGVKIKISEDKDREKKDDGKDGGGKKKIQSHLPKSIEPWGFQGAHIWT